MPAHRYRRSRARLAGLTAVAAAAALAVPGAAGGLGGPAVAGAAPATALAGGAAAQSPAAGAAPRVVSEKWIDARTVDLVVDSPAVGAEVPLRILLPTDFAAQPDRTWPVLYLLQGAHDDYTSWTRETDIEEFTAGRDLITVMPSSGSTGIPTDWWNFGFPGGSDYETFQVDEVSALLEERYRANDTRAVAGVSTGGYGAMAFAARHPGAFTAAASYSGVLHTTDDGMPLVIRAIVAREGLIPALLWGSPYLQRELWRERNPYARAEKLRGTRLYVSQGSGLAGGDPGDLEGALLEGTLWGQAHAFTGRLDDLGIPATTHLYQGGSHAWSSWQQEFRNSWPVLAAGLGLPS